MELQIQWGDPGFALTMALMGLLAAGAQAVVKKPPTALFSAAMKAMTGFVMFNLGVGAFLSAANAMRLLATAAFGVKAAPNTNVYFQTQGLYYIPVMILGFLLHLLLVKYLMPPGKRTVHMGGCHVLLRVAMLTTGVAVVVYGQTNWLAVVLFGTAVSGLWYWLQPLMAAPLVRRIRGDRNAGYGHQTSVSLLLTALVCRLLPKKCGEDDTEGLRLPSWTGLLRDMGICMCLLQTAAVALFCLLCGPAAVARASGGKTPWLWAAQQGLLFAAGYFTLTAGLRMITGEVMPALGALGSRLVPDGTMAMDVPALFPYGQNAVLFGAVSGSAVFFALLFLFARLGWGFIGGATLYFYMVAGGAAVYGNKVRGKLGAITGGMVTALCMAFGSLLIQRLGGAFYEMEYFCNVASEPDDRLLLYPLLILLGRLFFGKRAIPMG